MKRNKRINKLGLTVLALMMAVILYTPVSSMAKGNVKDTRYYAAYSGDGGDVFIDHSREKKDYTSCYIYNQDRTDGILVNIYATDRECDKYNYKTLRDCSVKAYFPIDKNEARYVQNYVKEWGYNYCTFMFAPTTHSPRRFEGVWSPDSI